MHSVLAHFSTLCIKALSKITFSNILNESLSKNNDLRDVCDKRGGFKEGILEISSIYIKDVLHGCGGRGIYQYNVSICTFFLIS